MCFFYIRFQFIKDLIESDVCLEWEQNEIEEKGMLFLSESLKKAEVCGKDKYFRLLGMPMA